jgi:hypothetical protein
MTTDRLTEPVRVDGPMVVSNAALSNFSYFSASLEGCAIATRSSRTQKDFPLLQ